MAKDTTTTVTRVRSGQTLRRLTIYLPDDVARAMRAHCALEERTLSEVQTELSEKWLRARRKL